MILASAPAIPKRAGSSTADFAQLGAAEDKRRARRLKNLDLVAAGKRAFPARRRGRSGIVIAGADELQRLAAARA